MMPQRVEASVSGEVLKTLHKKFQQLLSQESEGSICISRANVQAFLFYLDGAQSDEAPFGRRLRATMYDRGRLVVTKRHRAVTQASTLG